MYEEKSQNFQGLSTHFVWANVINYMSERLGADIIAVWFGDVAVTKLTANKITILVPRDFHRVIVEKRCVSYIETAFKDLFNAKITVSVCGPDSDTEFPSSLPEK